MRDGVDFSTSIHCSRLRYRAKQPGHAREVHECQPAAAEASSFRGVVGLAIRPEYRARLYISSTTARLSRFLVSSIIAHRSMICGARDATIISRWPLFMRRAR